MDDVGALVSRFLVVAGLVGLGVAGALAAWHWWLG